MKPHKPSRSAAASPAAIRRTLRRLFREQHLAVLATQGDGHPYGSLVGFAADRDLKFLVFCTPRATRKFANLKEDKRVAMVIDSRQGNLRDFHVSIAVTATGRAVEAKGEQRRRLLRLYRRRLPHLAEFAAAPSTALVKVKVDSYVIASRFQEVTVWKPQR